MKAVIYKEINEKIEKEWLALWRSSEYANNTNSPQWFLSALDAFEYKEYAVIAVYKKEKLVGIMGLVKEQMYGIPVYTVAPRDFTCGLPFLLDITDQAVISTMTQSLLELGNVFLNNIPKEIANILQKATNAIETKEKTINYYLPIVKDINGIVRLEKRKKFLKDVKGIEDKFSVKNFDGKTKEGLEMALYVDTQSRKQKRGYSVFANPRIKLFYHALVTHFKQNININILYFEEKPIAYEIGFMIGKSYFGSQISFITEYSKFSPGKVLLIKVIDYVASRNVSIMDFGSGESRIKQLLTSDSRILCQIMLSKNKFVRSYVTNLGQTKEYLFNKISHYIKLYSAYRKIKKIAHA
jgi:CelD/BcsL family acetyltransferase involved in cellulose biosynthesis